MNARLAAALYEPFLWFGERRGMRSHRAALLSAARGIVMEIGAGTGLNLAHYPGHVTRLILTEPDPAMYRRLNARVAGDPKATAMLAPGSRLPVGDASVDTVVSTMVLCTVPKVEPVLAEIARVLRPGGRLLFCEHVRSSDPALARRQDRFAPYWAAFAQGCRCNRDTTGLLRRRFDFERLEVRGWPGMPALVRPLMIGTAVPCVP